ncbi:YlxR family protein [Mycoplasmatota bacterium WC44]
MNKKIPLRKCIVTRERFPKNELVRIVKTKDGQIFVDETGKANGRGAYINLSKSTIKKAKDKKILNRVFETEIDDKIFEELLELYEAKNT